MVVLVTCKYEKDPIKNEDARDAFMSWLPASMKKIRSKMSWLPASMKKIRSKMKALEC